MNSLQQEIVELLRKSGSKFVRTAGKGGEVWRLPNGFNFITRTKRTNEHGVAHELADLRRRLGDVVVDELVKAGKKREQCAHNWERRGAALFCTRCSDIQTVTEQHKEEEQKMEPLKVVKEEPKQVKKAVPFDGVYKTHWTKAQDRALVEGYGARMSPAEIAILIQDLRPGATATHVKQRAANLRANVRALNGEPPPGKGKGVHGGKGLGVVPIEQTRGSAPPKLAPIVPERAPSAQERFGRQPALARVTFQIGDKVRVVDVDEAMARRMLQEALTL